MTSRSIPASSSTCNVCPSSDRCERSASCRATRSFNAARSACRSSRPRMRSDIDRLKASPPSVPISPANQISCCDAVVGAWVPAGASSRPSSCSSSRPASAGAGVWNSASAAGSSRSSHAARRSSDPCSPISCRNVTGTSKVPCSFLATWVNIRLSRPSSTKLVALSSGSIPMPRYPPNSVLSCASNRVCRSAYSTCPAAPSSWPVTTSSRASTPLVISGAAWGWR